MKGYVFENVSEGIRTLKLCRCVRMCLVGFSYETQTLDINPVILFKEGLSQVINPWERGPVLVIDLVSQVALVIKWLSS